MNGGLCVGSFATYCLDISDFITKVQVFLRQISKLLSSCPSSWQLGVSAEIGSVGTGRLLFEVIQRYIDVFFVFLFLAGHRKCHECSIMDTNEVFSLGNKFCKHFSLQFCGLSQDCFDFLTFHL